MPTKSQWLLELPAIVAQLNNLDVPVIDRACVEKLFGVARRRAIHLMHEFGGYQSGRTFLIDRHLLIRRLTAEADGDEYEYESRRRHKLSESLAALELQAKGAKIKVEVTPLAYQSTRRTLPAGVELSNGVLTVRYASNEELVQKLFVLAQALVNDFDAF